jgi:hypothetical protein
MRQISTLLLVFIFSNSFAQPYIDLATLRYVNSPANTGIINQNEPPLKLEHSVAGINLPIPLNKDKSAILLILPYLEQWQIGMDSGVLKLNGFGFPVGLSKKLNHFWGITAILFYRINKEKDLPDNSGTTQQLGGAFIFNYSPNERLTYKFGIYYNREFFGNFIVPLLGIDWRPDKLNAVFGTLPGAITWERKLNNHFYFGANFRAITNSYRTAISDPCYSGDCSIKGYTRIDENQIGMYADVYFGKHFVLNGEIGHSLFRKIRNGTKGDNLSSKYVMSGQDNFYFRIVSSYRLQLR